MFEKNDKILFIMRFVINVLSVVAGIVCIILGIVLAAKGVSNGYIILFGGVIGIGFFWLVWQLCFSYLCDIKLIRNKLYGADNDSLSVFLNNSQEDREEDPEQEDQEVSAEDKSAQEQSAEGDSAEEGSVEEVAPDIQKNIMLKKLKALKDKGRISEKEYQEKKKYIHNL